MTAHTSDSKCPLQKLISSFSLSSSSPDVAEMTGTIILTGANGSAGLHAAERLLRNYPEFTAVFTVRDASNNDINTIQLRNIMSSFASDIATRISNGQYPPLKSIICNASYWNLVDDSTPTVDGYDMTFQINHIAHVALVLRLINCFAADGGRIVLISTIAHYRKKTNMSPYLPEIPDDLNKLLMPPPDNDKQGRGFQRYSNSKLVATTWMYPLNRYLEKV
jgi:NAD(P)-dependent dehydrogenase (short-subunit alcohol dehydrogenase family)